MENKRIALIATLAALLALPSALLMHPAKAIDNNFVSLSMSPVPSKDGWKVNIEASIEGVAFNCSGVVTANPYYRETRAVSASLLAVPVYYVLDTVCPRLTAFLSIMKPSASPVHVTIKVPSDYRVYTAMDSRGFGSNGSYYLPLSLFITQYIFDGIVVASEKHYEHVSIGHLVLLEPRNESNRSTIAWAIGCVADFLRKELGPSNRSPVVIVVAAKWDHPYMLTGIGYSLGGVIYIKPGNDAPSIVHLVAHEAVHSWVGKGRLQGGPSLVEGVAELLSLLALRTCNKDLYKKAMLYEETSQEANPYAVWLRLHAAIRRASIEACGEDLYLESLHLLYHRGERDASILDLLSAIKELAEKHNCLSNLEESLGKALLGAKDKPLEQLVEIGNLGTGARRDAGASLANTASHVGKTRCTTRIEKDHSKATTNAISTSTTTRRGLITRHDISNTSLHGEEGISTRSARASSFPHYLLGLLAVFLAGVIPCILLCNRNIF